MTVALIDNGSIEPAAHRNLRQVAVGLSQQVGNMVHAVSWKHSDRIPALELDGRVGNTLHPWLKAQFDVGERAFVFVPFFISAQGAIGSALRDDLERLQQTLGHFDFRFTDGLAARDAISGIVASRIRETIAARRLHAPPVIVVDHGGPSPASAALRDSLAVRIRNQLGKEIGPLTAASMESDGSAHNEPLFAAQLAASKFNRDDIVIAPLFISPGRHAGPNGDLAQMAKAAINLTRRYYFTELIGTHPKTVEVLSAALRDALAKPPV